MSDSITISVLQTAPSGRSISENLKRAQELLFSAPKSDLFLLGEMFATGFETSETLEADSRGEVLQWMKNMAHGLNGAIAGSVAIKQEGEMRNRMYFVTPDGVSTFYDKHHLFSPGGEDRLFKRGEEAVSVEWRGARFRLCTCYDLRFPEWIRNRDRYDCLLISAAWPKSRILAWDILSRARAIENLCFAAASNAASTNSEGMYLGHSLIADYRGETLAVCEDLKECTCTTTMDLRAMREYRKRLPALDEIQE